MVSKGKATTKAADVNAEKVVSVLTHTVETEVTKRLGPVVHAAVMEAVVQASRVDEGPPPKPLAPAAPARKGAGRSIGRKGAGRTARKAPRKAATPPPKALRPPKELRPPKAGGVCAAVWLELDKMRKRNRRAVPTLKQILETARTSGWNENNTRVEYYQWRKFHGISAAPKGE